MMTRKTYFNFLLNECLSNKCIHTQQNLQKKHRNSLRSASQEAKLVKRDENFRGLQSLYTFYCITYPHKRYLEKKNKYLIIKLCLRNFVRVQIIKFLNTSYSSEAALTVLSSDNARRRGHSQPLMSYSVFLLFDNL